MCVSVYMCVSANGSRETIMRWWRWCAWWEWVTPERKDRSSLLRQSGVSVRLRSHPASLHLWQLFKVHLGTSRCSQKKLEHRSTPLQIVLAFQGRYCKCSNTCQGHYLPHPLREADLYLKQLSVLIFLVLEVDLKFFDVCLFFSFEESLINSSLFYFAGFFCVLLAAA